MNRVEVNNVKPLVSAGWFDYELVDSGNGAKLERYGKIYLVRPETQALWEPALSAKDWDIAHAVLEKVSGKRGEWKFKERMQEKWKVAYGNLQVWAKLTDFGHVGIFPEQIVQWQWLSDQIKQSEKKPKVLNLFGYTGLASLVAAEAGAIVTHLDASRPSVIWAAENQKLSGLEAKPIRWIIDDAVKFVKREVRRGNVYDGIIMDPPQFGRGPKGELWKFNEDITPLMHVCRDVLTPNPDFFVLTAYTTSISPISLGNLLGETVNGYKGTLECGETAIRESQSQRLLAASMYTRWTKHET